MANEFALATEEFMEDLAAIRSLVVAFDDPLKGTPKTRVAAANSATLLLAATFEEYVREMALTCAKLVIQSATRFEDLPRNIAPTAWRRTLATLTRIDVSAGNPNGSSDAELALALTRFNAVHQFCNGDLSQDIYADLIHNENNMRPNEINALFKLSNVTDICSKISDKAPLIDNFGESEQGKTHGKLLKYLNEFFERRNEIAHSLRLVRSSGPAQILHDVDVFDAIGRSLAETMNNIMPQVVPRTPAPEAKPQSSWWSSWTSPGRWTKRDHH
ncbi:HEPN domain-containing protein [Bradyrhizobium sp. 187]|uniref:HEPN domain-containing protein n=1 Tax=Bradyrhizobium sp. 187 TaxID=2782655 RepID=UPI001FFF18C6|nr:HEPN domain-containing protein [Bradyrhizobium sp. 187]UPJ72795.1 hypothetical protein IVB19_35555 [Bradyrhizobium sp. 187]